MSLDAHSTHDEEREADWLSQCIAFEPDPIQREVLRERFHRLSVTKNPTVVGTSGSNHKAVFEAEQKANSQRRGSVIKAKRQRRPAPDSTMTPDEIAQKLQRIRRNLEDEQENSVLHPTPTLPCSLSVIVADYTSRKLLKVQEEILNRFDVALRALPEGSRQDDVINLLIAFRKDVINILDGDCSAKKIHDAARIMKAVHATLYAHGFFSLDRAQRFAYTYDMAFFQDEEAEQEEV